MKIEGWEDRLAEFLNCLVGVPFEYGVNDCALLGAGVIRAQTGIDPAEPFRGKYSTFAGGLKIVRRAGFEDQLAVLRPHLKEKPRLHMRPGDIAILDEGQIGVVVGRQVAALSPTGLGFLSLNSARRIFTVA